MADNKINVTTRFNQDLIEQETDVLGQVTRNVIRLQDEGIRKALIDLGWTPPAESIKVPAPQEKEDTKP